MRKRSLGHELFIRGEHLGRGWERRQDARGKMLSYELGEYSDV